MLPLKDSGLMEPHAKECGGIHVFDLDPDAFGVIHGGVEDLVAIFIGEARIRDCHFLATM
jgi:hypothetical protein